MSETIEDIVRKMREHADFALLEFGCDQVGLRRYADRIEAAARPRRELLCRLRDDNIALNIENSELRALVKELADALETINSNIDYDPSIGGKWTIGDEDFESLHTGALVARAREVVK